jgi:hypothetical protein
MYTLSVIMAKGYGGYVNIRVGIKGLHPLIPKEIWTDASVRRAELDLLEAPGKWKFSKNQLSRMCREISRHIAELYTLRLQDAYEEAGQEPVGFDIGDWYWNKKQKQPAIDDYVNNMFQIQGGAINMGAGVGQWFQAPEPQPPDDFMIPEGPDDEP